MLVWFSCQVYFTVLGNVLWNFLLGIYPLVIMELKHRKCIAFSFSSLVGEIKSTKWIWSRRSWVWMTWNITNLLAFIYVMLCSANDFLSPLSSISLTFKETSINNNNDDDLKITTLWWLNRILGRPPCAVTVNRSLSLWYVGKLAH